MASRRRYRVLLVALLAGAVLLACGETRQPATVPAMTQVARADDALPAGAEDVSAMLEPLRVKYDLPALGGAIVTSRGIEALGVTGVRAYGDKTPARPSDPFHLGSDGKAMTALVVAKAIESGKLSWTSTIGQVLADVPMHAGYKDVTVEQLLSHRGGFPHDQRALDVNGVRRLPGTVRQQRDAYVKLALADEPEAPPGQKEIYSNTGYVLAAVMAERALGADYESLLKSVVLDPLGMRGAGFGAAGQPKEGGGEVLAPWPHRADPGGEKHAIEPGPDLDNPPAVAPAGTMHMPLEAWSRFVIEELRGARGAGTLLRADTYATLFAPHLGGTYFAGWKQVERDWAGGTAYMHAGSNTLNYALAWVAPQKDVAYLVVTNQGDTKDATFKSCDAIIGALIKHHDAHR